ncbi:hypothetical protein A2U01_0102047, partial [Trifolium medium]|nr:hypothetical protein [Trifolium medium]
KDGASRQQRKRKTRSFCHLRVAQERTARSAGEDGASRQSVGSLR